MLTNKRLLDFALPLIILIVAILGVIGYFAYKNTNLNKSATVVTTTPVPIEDWNYYADITGKFSFRFPPDFNLKEENINIIRVAPGVGGLSLEKDPKEKNFIHLGVLDASTSEFRYRLGSSKNIHKSLRNKLATLEYETPDPWGKGFSYYTVEFSSGNFVYKFSAPQDIKPILEQIVSTFRFLR